MERLIEHLSEPVWWIVAVAAGLGLWLFGWWGVLLGPVAFVAMIGGLLWQVSRGGADEDR